MQRANKMIYIAGPFFDADQLKVIKDIENWASTLGVTFFSPRKEGVIKNMQDMTEVEKKLTFARIYNANITNIDRSDAIVAVIDDFDPGTIFEIGYAAKARKRIITISTKGHGLNVMLSHCIDEHVDSPAKSIRAYLGENVNSIVPETTT